MEKIHFIDVGKVKRLMAEKGFDDKTMAERMGITPRTLKRFLDGADQRSRGTYRLIQILNALEVSARDIMIDKK